MVMGLEQSPIIMSIGYIIYRGNVWVFCMGFVIGGNVEVFLGSGVGDNL